MPLCTKIQLNRIGFPLETGGGCKWGAISRTGGKYSPTTDGFDGTTIGGRYKDFGVDGFSVVFVTNGGRYKGFGVEGFKVVVVGLRVVVVIVCVVGFRDVGGRYSVFGGR